MVDKIEVESVLAVNRERQRQAKVLNVRAGADLFKVFALAELQDFVFERLGGARNIREITNPEAVRLPALDEELVAKVVRENPDMINILGVDLAVEYRVSSYTRYNPLVNLSVELVASNRWLELPDEGVKLPGGRLVEVLVSIGYYTTISNTDISQLKAKVREHLNQEQWTRWARPTMASMDHASPGAVIPEIATAQYGTCVVTGEPLMAYGAFKANPHRYYSSDPYFKSEWYRLREEADKARAQAVAELEAIRAQVAVQAELDSAKAVADETRGEVSRLYDEHRRTLPVQLGNKLYDRRFFYGSGLEVLKGWVTETKALIAEAEEYLARENAQRDRAERELAEYGWPKTYLYANAEGQLFVFCAKRSKLGECKVIPSLGDQVSLVSPSGTDGNQWRPIPWSQEVLWQDFSSSGNLKDEVIFEVWEGDLDFGVWAVSVNHRDETWFRPVAWAEGEEEVYPPDQLEPFTYDGEDREDLVGDEDLPSNQTLDQLRAWSGKR
jgi:hypothetical protein